MRRGLWCCFLLAACAEPTRSLDDPGPRDARAQPDAESNDAGSTSTDAAPINTDAAPIRADAAPTNADAGAPDRPPPALGNTLLGDGEHAPCGAAIAWNGRTVVVLWCELGSTTPPTRDQPLDARYFWTELEPGGALLSTRPMDALPGLVPSRGLVWTGAGYAAITVGAFDNAVALSLLDASGALTHGPTPLPADTEVELALAGDALVFAGRLEGGQTWGRVELASGRVVESGRAAERPDYLAARWRGDHWLQALALPNAQAELRRLDALGHAIAPAERLADGSLPLDLLDDRTIVSRPRPMNARRVDLWSAPDERLLVEDAAWYHARGRAERVDADHAALAWPGGSGGFNGTVGFAWITARGAQPCVLPDVSVQAETHMAEPALAVLDQGDVAVLWHDYRAHPYRSGQGGLPRASYAYQRVRAGLCP